MITRCKVLNPTNTIKQKQNKIKKEGEIEDLSGNIKSEIKLADRPV